MIPYPLGTGERAEGALSTPIGEGVAVSGVFGVIGCT